jgi:hypothetical protein
MSESMGGIIPECPGDFVGIRTDFVGSACQVRKMLIAVMFVAPFVTAVVDGYRAEPLC